MPRQQYKPYQKKSRSGRIIGIGLIVTVVVTAVVFGLLHEHNKTKVAVSKTSANKTAALTTKAQPITDPDADRIRLITAGDFLAHDTINAAAKQPDGSYNYLPLMSSFQPIFKAADIRFCNDGNLNGGAQFGISGYPTFNSPPEFVTGMQQVGCNMVADAENHSFDRSQDAINASVDAWNKQPDMLAVAGENQNQAQHDAVHYFSVKGVKFAFLDYTTYFNTDAPPLTTYGANFYSNAFAAQQIAEAKQNGAQIIIASVRWGVEYSQTVSQAQTTVAQYLADQGVSLIIGDGSHVLQPVQQLTGSGGNKTTVWYSVGNFITTQEPAETLFNGLGVIDFSVKTKQVTDMSFLPIYMHYNWTAAQQAADDTNARTDPKMFLLEDTTQAMIDSEQLKTTVAAQKTRLQTQLDADGLNIPLITSAQYYAQ